MKILVDFFCKIFQVAFPCIASSLLIFPVCFEMITYYHHKITLVCQYDSGSSSRDANKAFKSQNS